MKVWDRSKACCRVSVKLQTQQKMTLVPRLGAQTPLDYTKTPRVLFPEVPLERIFTT